MPCESARIRSVLSALLPLLSVVALPGPALAFVDTGQDRCYDDAAEIAFPSPGDPYYGQDAQYAGDGPSLTLGADSLTVHDDITGLTWQRLPDTDGDGDLDSDDKVTWTECQAIPAALNAQSFAGHDDWRLPTITELYSLIDYRGVDPNPNGSDTSGLTPFIDTDVFAFVYGTRARESASSTPSTGRARSTWGSR